MCMALCVCCLCSLSVFCATLNVRTSFVSSLVLQRLLCFLKQELGHVEADSKNVPFMLFFMDLMPPCSVQLLLYAAFLHFVSFWSNTQILEIVFYYFLFHIVCISNCICFLGHQLTSPFFISSIFLSLFPSCRQGGKFDEALDAVYGLLSVNCDNTHRTPAQQAALQGQGNNQCGGGKSQNSSNKSGVCENNQNNSNLWEVSFLFNNLWLASKI